MCFSCLFGSPRNAVHATTRSGYAENAQMRTLNGPVVVDGQLVQPRRNNQVISHGFVPVASERNFTPEQLKNARDFFKEQKERASLREGGQEMLAASKLAATAATSTTVFVQEQLFSKVQPIARSSLNLDEAPPFEFENKDEPASNEARTLEFQPGAPDDVAASMRDLKQVLLEEDFV